MSTITQQNNRLAYKVVLLGAGGVGKTSLVRKLLNERDHMGVPIGSSSSYVPTLGIEVYPFKVWVRINNGMPTPFRLNLWDIAGQSRFGGLREGYYQNSDAAIVVDGDGIDANLVQQSLTSFTSLNPSAKITHTTYKDDMDLEEAMMPIRKLLADIIGVDVSTLLIHNTL